jgi:dihydroorotate dehydrogenase
MNQCLCSEKYWYACSCSANINTETSLTTAKGLTNIQIFDAMENINKDYSEFYTEQRSIITNINENKQNIKRYIIINKKLNPKINLQDINLACEEHIEFIKIVSDEKRI